MPQSVFIARNALTNLHSVFEVLPSAFRQGREGTLEIKELNSLISWTDVGEMTDVLEEHGPFIASDLRKGVPRVVPIDDVIEIAEAASDRGASGFISVDEDILWMQMYLDGRVGSYPSRLSVSRATRKYNLIGKDPANELRAWKAIDPGCSVAVEPLADLVATRNLASILLRVIANCQNELVGNVLTESGFVSYNPKLWKLAYKEIDRPCLMVPFRHNTAVDGSLNLSGRWWRNVNPGDVSNSLCCLIGSLRPKGSKFGFGDADGVMEVTAQIANGRAAPLINIAVDYAREDTRKYLCVVDSGNERDSAERFVESIAKLIHHLKADDGTPIGWSFGDMSSILDNEYPRPVFHTLMGAILGSVFFRYGSIPATCKNCGNGMLVSPKGKRREFCSASCKTQYSNKSKQKRFASRGEDPNV